MTLSILVSSIKWISSLFHLPGIALTFNTSAKFQHKKTNLIPEESRSSAKSKTDKPSKTQVKLSTHLMALWQHGVIWAWRRHWKKLYCCKSSSQQSVSMQESFLQLPPRWSIQWRPSLDQPEQRFLMLPTQFWILLIV